MLGKSIEHILTTNAAINALVENRVYPISANSEGLPAIYYSVSVIPHYNNNGQQMQNWTVSVLTMCLSYSQAWDLAKLIMRAFHAKRRRTVETVKYTEVRCTLIKDDYEFQVGSFGHILEFDIRTQNLI